MDVADKYITLAETLIGEHLKLDIGSTFESVKLVKILLIININILIILIVINI